MIEEKVPGIEFEDTLLDKAAEVIPATIDEGPTPGKWHGDDNKTPDGLIKEGNELGGVRHSKATGLRAAKQIINEILLNVDSQDHLRERLQEWFLKDPVHFLFQTSTLFAKEEKRELEITVPLRIIHEVEKH